MHLRKVFRRLNIRLRLDEHIWGVDKTEYLRFLIYNKGITPTEKYKRKIITCKVPTGKKEMCNDEMFMYDKMTVCLSHSLTGIQAMNPKRSHALSVQIQ